MVLIEQIKVTDGPNVLQFAETAKVTSVQFKPNDFQLRHTAEATWPNVTPPGWDGPIQWTLYVVVGTRAVGCIEMWKGRLGVGSPFSSAQKDWFYYTSLPQPKPGDEVGFFAVAGDFRRKDVRSVEERSNIVWVKVPAGDTGTFIFNEQPPIVNDPVPPPASLPEPGVLTYLQTLDDHLTESEARIIAKIDALAKQQADAAAYAKPFFEFLNRWFGVGKK